MVFKRLQTDFIEIDGVSYEVSNSANQDHFDCKEKFLNLIFHIELGYDEDGTPISVDSLAGWKKELISKLKEFEKKYVKHAKTTNPYLSEIHKKSMQPVVDLWEASVNLQNFRKLSKTREFPEFRKKALTEKFVMHLTEVCRILKAFPNLEDNTLNQEYDIQHILDILFEIENWDQCPPFKFYFDPMLAAYDELVNELRRMWKDGPLRASYYVERNTEMTKKIYELVRQYQIVLALAGDELKRDQFKFAFSVHDCVYKSALKDIFLNSKQNAVVMQSVIPEMTVFKAMLHIRDVDDRKAADIVKKEQKAKERAE